MLGYIVYGQDNDTYAFRDRPAIREDTDWYEYHQTLAPDFSGESRPSARRCRKCGELLAKWEEPLFGLVLKKKQYDISATYDGLTIVSQRFKQAYNSNDLSGLDFRELPDEPGFFSIRPLEELRFDPRQALTRFENQCPACGRYESVIGAEPFFKDYTDIPDRGFVRTDLEFASGDGKHPLIICGPTAGRILEAAKLKGLDLMPF